MAWVLLQRLQAFSSLLLSNFFETIDMCKKSRHEQVVPKLRGWLCGLLFFDFQRPLEVLLQIGTHAHQVFWLQ